MQLDVMIMEKKEMIKLVGLEVGKAGPSGIVCDTHMNDATLIPRTYYNGIARCMDYILRDFAVNALSPTDNKEKVVYVEYEKDGVLYSCNFDGTNMNWEGSKPDDYGLYLPILFHALMYKDVQQLKDCYADIVKEAEESITVSKPKMLIFCDSFYHDALRPYYLQLNIEENVPITEPVKRAFINGYYEHCPVLDNVKSKPVVHCIQNISSEMATAYLSGVIGKENWTDCMEGKYKIPYVWPEDMQEYIPSPDMMKEYYPVDKFFRLLNKVTYRMDKVLRRMDIGLKGNAAIKKDYINCTLTGKPGTGKTVMLYVLAAALGIPICSINASKGTDEDTFQGMNKVVNGQIQFVETEFLKFYQNGGIIILEEVNLCDPGVTMGALGQAVEFPFVLKKDGYETVHRHPLCMIFSTKNINTYGSKGVNQAFSNRFSNSVLLDDPTDEDFIAILEKSGFERQKCEWVQKAYQRITNHLLSSTVGDGEEALLSLSMRTCIAALQTIEEGIDPKTALEDTFVGKIAETDVAMALRVRDDVIANLTTLY